MADQASLELEDRMVNRNLGATSVPCSRRGAWILWTALVLGVGCGGQSEKASSSGNPPGDGGAAGGGAGAGSPSGGTRAGTAGFAGTAGGGHSGAGMAGSAASGAAAGVAGQAASGGTTGGTGVAGGGGAGVAGEGGTGPAGEGGADQAAGGVAGVGGVVDVPGFDDLIVRSSNMAPYEGLRVIATFDQNIVVDSRSAPRAGTITDGAFTLRWDQEFDRDSFGTYVVLFVDRDGDGWCNEGEEPAWSFFGNNDTPWGQPLVLDFDPDVDANTDPITCAEFDDWFDEPYEGL